MANVEIKTKNDGKCKDQSWEAWTEIELPVMGEFWIENGYGRTEEEAIADYKENYRKAWLYLASVTGDIFIND